MKYNIDTFFEMIPAIADAAGILPVLSFQAITVPAMEAMQQDGGNALGLDLHLQSGHNVDQYYRQRAHLVV
jgi:hypothetical protein